MHRASGTEIEAERLRGREAERQNGREAEREAQFYYNFYAAKQAMDYSHYDQAFYLLTLCNTILPEDGKTLEYLGIIYDVLKQKDLAGEYFSRAYACSPKEFYKYHLGYLINDKDWDRAFLVATQATKDNAEDPDAWNSLLQVAMQIGNYPSATQAVNEIDRLLGYSRYTALVRYDIAIRQSQNKQALKVLDTYLEEDPTDVAFLQQKALLLEATKAKGKVLIPVYQAVLKYAPDNALILNNYAYYLATHKGDLNQAEKMSFKAIQLQLENPSFLDTYGWILHLQGKDNLAKFYLQKALNIVGNHPGQIEIRKHLEKIK